LFLFKDSISRNYSAGRSVPTSSFPKSGEESIRILFLFPDHSPFPTDSPKSGKGVSIIEKKSPFSFGIVEDELEGEIFMTPIGLRV
jgi:hypothetical protein